MPITNYLPCGQLNKGQLNIIIPKKCGNWLVALDRNKIFLIPPEGEYSGHKNYRTFGLNGTKQNIPPHSGLFHPGSEYSVSLDRDSHWVSKF